MAGGAASRFRLMHRVRFVDWNPSSITAIALTPSTYDPHTHYTYSPSLHHSGGSGREVLAVGRQNGNIEIYVWLGDQDQGSLQAATSSSRSRNQKADDAQDGATGSSAATAPGADAPAGSTNNKAAKHKRKRPRRKPANASPGTQGWVLERTLAAPYPSRVEHLVFTHQTQLSADDLDLYDEQEQERELQKLKNATPRLFSAGGGSDVWEWDWSDGSLGYVKRSLSSQGGAIWSMACNPQGTTLALGCDDGAVRLVNLWDGEFEHLRRFDAIKTRLLSLAWGPMMPVKGGDNNNAGAIKPADSGKGKQRAVNGSSFKEAATQQQSGISFQYEDVMLVTGCADSSIRIWDVRSGRSTFKMTTDKIRGDNTLVWCVAVLSDMTVVSGDSMGLVKFWDGRMGTQLQSVTAHKADVLTLAVAANGRTIYTSGVDQYVAELAQVPLEDSSGSQQRKTRTQWIRSGYKRYHSHDVRALAVSPALSLRTGSEEPTPDAARPSIVLSGGLDFSLVLMAVKSHRSASDQTQDSPMGATLASTSNPLASVEITTFDASRARKASYIPQRNHPIAFAAEARLLASIREGGVDLWQVGDASNVDQASSGKVLEMNIKSKTRFTSTALSSDGRWLAVSDRYETKVFKIRISSDGIMKAHRSHAVSEALSSHELLKDDQGASFLHFTQDSGRLVIATVAGSRVAIISLPEDKDAPASVLRVFSQHRSRKHFSRRATAGKLVNGKYRSNGNAVDGKADAQMAIDGSSGSEDSSPSSSSSSENEDEEGDDANRASRSTIACIATSPDNQWLVTADMARRMHVFNLDTLRYHASLPTLSVPVKSLAFSTVTPAMLAVGLANNDIHFFDVDTRSLPTWANSVSSAFSRTLKREKEPLLGVLFDPAAGPENTLVVYASNWLLKTKIGEAAQTAVDGSSERTKKRGRREGETQAARLRSDKNSNVADSGDEGSTDDGEDGKHDSGGEDPVATTLGITITQTQKYQPMLHLDFTIEGDMVVVERPFFDLLRNMAPAFVGGRFGR